jgi:hypothetical protein
MTSRLEDLRGLLSRQQQQVLATPGGLREGGLGFSLAMLEHARGHLPLYRAILGRESGTFVLQRIHRMMADLVEIDLKAIGLKSRADPRALAVASCALPPDAVFATAILCRSRGDNTRIVSPAHLRPIFATSSGVPSQSVEPL